MDELSTHGKEDLYDEQAAAEARETAKLEDEESGGVFAHHHYPLKYLGRAAVGITRREEWQCERCERVFTERTPTEYAGCCVSLAEQERQSDAYMEHGQPGGIA